MHKRKLSDVPFRQRMKCTVTEAIEYGGVSKNRVHDWIKSGRTKSTVADPHRRSDGEIRGRRLIDVPSLLAVLDGNKPGAAA